MHATNGNNTELLTVEEQNTARKLMAMKSALLKAQGTIDALSERLDAARLDIQTAIASIDASHQQIEMAQLLKAPERSRW